MKTYHILIACILLFACSGSTEDTENTIDEIVEIPEGPYEYDQDLSKACNLCLLNDAKYQLEVEKISLLATRGDLGTIEQDLDDMEIQFENLLQQFKNSPSFNSTRNSLKSDGFDYSDMLVAGEACREEFPLRELESKTEEAELFSQYIAYTAYIELPFWDPEEDTSQYRVNNHYEMKVKGVKVQIPSEEFPAYWQECKNTWSDIHFYRMEKRNEVVIAFTGKEIQDLSAVELWTFESHASHQQLPRDKFYEIVEKDGELQNLIQAWYSAMNYEN